MRPSANSLSWQNIKKKTLNILFKKILKFLNIKNFLATGWKSCIYIYIYIDIDR